MKILGWLCIGLGLFCWFMPFFMGPLLFLGAVFLIIAAINASARRKVDVNVDVQYHPPQKDGISNSMFGRR
jgi:hypothetical protein